MKKNSLLLIFSPIILFADYSWERSSAEFLINDGIHALYNYEFESAISILDSAWKLDDSHPLIPFVLISAKWLKTQTQEGYTASYDMINNEVGNAVPQRHQVKSHANFRRPKRRARQSLSRQSRNRPPST